MKGPCSQKNLKHMTSDEMSHPHPMPQGNRGSDRHVTNARNKPKLLKNILFQFLDQNILA